MTEQRLSRDALSPRVGVAAIVSRGDRVLLGERIEAAGDVWQFPGGRLDFGEEFFACATRETFEETGLMIECNAVGPVTNTLFPGPARHWVTVFVMASSVSGEAQVREPDKCRRWDWFQWDALPVPLFLPVEELLQTGFRPDRRAKAPC